MRFLTLHSPAIFSPDSATSYAKEWAGLRYYLYGYMAEVMTDPRHRFLKGITGGYDNGQKTLEKLNFTGIFTVLGFPPPLSESGQMDSYKVRDRFYWCIKDKSSMA